MKLFAQLMAWANKELNAGITTEDGDVDVQSKLESAVEKLKGEKTPEAPVAVDLAPMQAIIDTQAATIVQLQADMASLTQLVKASDESQTALTTKVTTFETKLDTAKHDFAAQVSTAIAEMKTGKETINNVIPKTKEAKEGEELVAQFNEADWKPNQVKVRTTGSN